MRDLLTTGVPNLDVLLGGGLPARQSIVVSGNPGTGKTILCSQIAFAQAARWTPVTIVTVTSEPHDKLLEELRGFDFFDERRVGNEIFLLSAYSALKRGVKEARELLLGNVHARGSKLLFIDGLRSIRDLWQDESKVREFMYELSVGLSAHDCTGIFSTEYSEDRLLALPEATTVDGIVMMTAEASGTRRYRKCEVLKLRGRKHVQGAHALKIDRSGITIFPKLETVTPPDTAFRTPKTRAMFDHPELDALLGGGLPTTSATLVAGSTGIGKTLLSFGFAAAGARRGEKAVFVSFYEAPQPLIDRAASVGIEAQSLVDRGDLVIEYVPPSELDADELLTGLLERVRALGAKRFVVDGLLELERAVDDPVRTRDFLVAVLISLRTAGITSVFTKDVAKIAGSDLDFSDTPTSLIAENLIFLRHVELRGRLHRIVSVLKMRASKYDDGIREFDIQSTGIKVLEPVRTVAGLLTGQARPLDGARDDA
ncbi:MAG: RAD55 family ATPase [Planctomycetota bacterium]